MNLVYHYPSIYWATGVLTVNSGGLSNEEGKAKGTNYGKLSSAIGMVQEQGVKVMLPDINKAKLTFTPDVENNSIIFGLKGISEVNDGIIKEIIDSREYSSSLDFLEKVKPQNKVMINLIKGGAFDELDGIDRTEIMRNYLKIVAPKKEKITMQNMSTLINYGLIPKEFISYVQLFNFNKYLKTLETPSGYRADSRVITYITKNFDNDLIDNNYIDKKRWEKTYAKTLIPFKTWLQENQKVLMDKVQDAQIAELWNKYCPGTKSTWEMDVLSFYYSGHELADIDYGDIEITKLTDLPETPEVLYNYTNKQGKAVSVSKIYTIAGTVLDRTPYKHSITLLTTEGVITLKMIGEQFSKYDRTISETDKETGKKTVLEKSWFKKGTLLLVSGWKSGDQFMVRGRASDNIFPLRKIVKINEDKTLVTTRFRVDEV